MDRLTRRPRIKKTCDFCNSSAFGLMRRDYKGKTFCSAFCEASFTNFGCSSGPSPFPPRGIFITSLRLSVTAAEEKTTLAVHAHPDASPLRSRQVNLGPL